MSSVCLPLLSFLLALAWAHPASAACPSVFPRENDYGFFWGRAAEGGGLVFEKSCTRTASVELAPGFVCNRATHIYIHGLYTDAVRSRARIWDNPDYADALQKYVATDYNIGFFEYSQFAEEKLPFFARVQGKIENPRYTSDMEFTFLDDDNRTSLADWSTRHSIAELFAHDYAAHMRQCPDAWTVGVTFIGHSLGGAFAVTAATLVMHDDAVIVKPARVALLDPVFSSTMQAYLFGNPCGDRVTDVVACRMQALLAADVAVEYYLSSMLNECVGSSRVDNDIVYSAAYAKVHLTGEGDTPLGKCHLAEVVKDPSIASGLGRQIYYQHMKIVPWYMSSVVDDPPPVRCLRDTHTDQCMPLNSLALSGGMATADVLYWARKPTASSAFCFVQYVEEHTEKTGASSNFVASDDRFFLVACDKMSI